MTLSEDRTMYCTICGGPIFDDNTFYEPEWLGEAILFTPETPHQDSLIVELPAINQGGPFFELSNNGQKVIACDNEARSAFLNPQPPLYLASHVNCFQIAKLVVLSGPVDGLAMPPWTRLWRVLEERYDTANGHMPQNWLNEPNAYRSEYWKGFVDTLVWDELAEDDPGKYIQQHIVADPSQIPGMTESILSSLQPLSIKNNRSSPRSREEEPTPNLSQLPPEIMHQIMAQLGPFSDPPLQCDFLVSPAYWRQALLNTNFLPWLPKLDTRLIMEKEDSVPAGQEWNWELLARQLAQTELYNPIPVPDSIPLGLRNRRRIWLLVEDILATEVS